MISAVTESAFASRRQRDWGALTDLVRRAASRGIASIPPAEIALLSPLYLDACADLARARAARYSAPLVDYLQGLTASAHAVLYGAMAHTGRAGLRAARLRAAFEAFPRAVRAHRWAMLLSAVLFFVPLAAGVIAALREPGFAFRIAPEAMLRPLTESYAKGFAEGRDAGQNALMAGFYVNNNVGIALRCFALGIFGGLGSVFFLVQNGLTIGAVLGYVASAGAGANIVTFIVGHGSFELGAVVIAGGAGLSLGWSVVSPGDRTRIASLQACGRDVVVLVAGAAAMLLVAAGIEGFWSGSSAPGEVKRALGLVLFLAVVAYLSLVGRGQAQRRVS